MSILILIRHGECLWHSKNNFTGWIDVPLSSKGIIDAIKAGNRIASISLDLVVASMQIRAIETAMIALTQCKENKTPMLIHDDETIENWVASNNEIMQKGIIPVFRNRTLNIQCELQENKKIKIRNTNDNPIRPWCYSYNKPLHNDACMSDTGKRTIPFFEKIIVPLLKDGKNIMLSAHNNSLRPIVSFIEKQTTDNTSGLELPTGTPLCFEFTNEKVELKNIEAFGKL